MVLATLKLAILPSPPSSCSIRSTFFAQPIRHPTLETPGVMASVSIGKCSNSFVVPIYPQTFIVPFIKFVPAISVKISVREVTAVHTPVMEQEGALAVALVSAKVSFIHITIFVLVNAPTVSTVINKVALIAIPVGCS